MPALHQLPPELAGRERFSGEQLTHRGGELGGVGVAHAPAEDAVVLALDHDLDQRTQQQRVANGHQMDRASHQRQPHRLALGEHPSQLVRVEALEPRPEAVVRRHRGLGLQPEEVLELLGNRRVHAAQQVLALEQRPVECAPGQSG